MIYAVFFIPREGVHPCAKLEDYSKLWPIMHRSVRKLGHKLVHITDHSTPCWGDSAFRVDVDPATTIYSRDVAWLAFLRQLPDGEQACMIEPDTLMLKDVPPIKDGHDLVILRRPQKCVPGWFKLAKNTAVPFFEAVVQKYEEMAPDLRVFHGDIGALHRCLGIANGIKAHTIPKEAFGCRIEVREWLRYGFRKAPTSDPILLQFKGDSKREMLAYQ